MEATNVAPKTPRKRRFPIVRVSAATALIALAGSAIVTTVTKGKTANSNTPSE